MSEIIQQKNVMTFKDIVPLWYDALTGKGKSKILDMNDPRYCIAGEAHDFGKGDHFEYGCDKCQTFGNISIGSFYAEYKDVEFGITYTEAEINNNLVVQDFVKHWNEVHVK